MVVNIYKTIYFRDVLPSLEREDIGIFLTDCNSPFALFSASTALSMSSLVLNMSEIMSLDTALA